MVTEQYQTGSCLRGYSSSLLVVPGSFGTDSLDCGTDINAKRTKSLRKNAKGCIHTRLDYLTEVSVGRFKSLELHSMRSHNAFSFLQR